MIRPKKIVEVHNVNGPILKDNDKWRKNPTVITLTIERACKFTLKQASKTVGDDQ